MIYSILSQCGWGGSEAHDSWPLPGLVVSQNAGFSFFSFLSLPRNYYSYRMYSMYSTSHCM